MHAGKTTVTYVCASRRGTVPVPYVNIAYEGNCRNALEMMTVTMFRVAVMLAGCEVQGLASSAKKYGVYETPASLPDTSEGQQHHFWYLPAPPGQTPSCAQSGATFCNRVDNYPTYVVRQLIEKWACHHNTLLRNENLGEIYERKRNTQVSGREPSESENNSSRHRENKFSKGYADRRYFLNVDEIGLTYGSSVMQTVQSFNHFVDPRSRWRAYRRRRRRRQASSRINIDICPTEARYIAPQAALNQQGNWMYIVNLPETDTRYTQLVRAELCTKPKQECNAICGLPEGYSSQCVQKFVQKRLVALEGAGRRLYTDVFWLPHGCSCQIAANTVQA